METVCAHCSTALGVSDTAGWALFFEPIAAEAAPVEVEQGLSLWQPYKARLCQTCAPQIERTRAVYVTEQELDAMLAGTATEEAALKEAQAKHEAKLMRQKLAQEGKKRCESCNVVLPLGCFQADKKMIDGYKTTCKPCKKSSRSKSIA